MVLGWLTRQLNVIVLTLSDPSFFACWQSLFFIRCLRKASVKWMPIGNFRLSGGTPEKSGFPGGSRKHPPKTPPLPTPPKSDPPQNTPPKMGSRTRPPKTRKFRKFRKKVKKTRPLTVHFVFFDPPCILSTPFSTKNEG